MGAPPGASEMGDDADPAGCSQETRTLLLVLGLRGLVTFHLSGLCPWEETCGHSLIAQAQLPPASLSLSFLPEPMKSQVNEAFPSDGKTRSGPVMS